MIPIEDSYPLERLVEEEAERQDIEAARAAVIEPGENVSLEEIKRELGL